MPKYGKYNYKYLFSYQLTSGLVVLLWLIELVFPHVLFAQTTSPQFAGQALEFKVNPDVLSLSSEARHTIASRYYQELPIASGSNEAEVKVKIWRYISVTAYNSLPSQTDSTPFETANGVIVRDGVVAANFLPLGTKVRFPEEFGAKVFTVLDRMNVRYRQRADIWMHSQTVAQQFGVRYMKIEILE